MNHLSEEQLEDILAGRTDEPAEMDPASRRKLEAMRAVRHRLQAAMASAEPSASLAEGIAAKLDDADSQAQPRVIRFPAWAWKVVAAAAVVTLIAVPIWFQFGRAEPALAAQEEFYQIHHTNLAHGGDFVEMTDPNAVSAHLAPHLQAPLRVPVTEDVDLQGACAARFRGRAAASYLVRTPHGLISVVVVREDPETFHFDRRHTDLMTDRAVYQGQQDEYRLLATRVGNLTYCVIGQVNQEGLLHIMAILIAN